MGLLRTAARIRRVNRLNRRRFQVRQFARVVINSAVEDFRAILVLYLNHRRRGKGIDHFLPLTRLNATNGTIRRQRRCVQRCRIKRLFCNRLRSLFPILHFRCPVMFLRRITRMATRINVIFCSGRHLTNNNAFFLHFL